MPPATDSRDEGRFRPHVTLARARDRHGAAVPSLPVESLQTSEVPVRGVALMRSHLGHGPARYEPLGTVPLAVAAMEATA